MGSTPIVHTNLKVGTPRQVAEALQSEGYSISIGAIRRMVKDGSIPHMKTGNRILVNKELIRTKLEYGMEASLDVSVKVESIPCTTPKSA